MVIFHGYVKWPDGINHQKNIPESIIINHQLLTIVINHQKNIKPYYYLQLLTIVIYP